MSLSTGHFMQPRCILYLFAIFINYTKQLRYCQYVADFTFIIVVVQKIK